MDLEEYAKELGIEPVASVTQFLRENPDVLTQIKRVKARYGRKMPYWRLAEWLEREHGLENVTESALAEAVRSAR